MIYKDIIETLSSSSTNFGRISSFSKHPLTPSFREILVTENFQKTLIKAFLSAKKHVKGEDFMLKMAPYMRLFNKVFSAEILQVSPGSVPKTPFNFDSMIQVLEVLNNLPYGNVSITRTEGTHEYSNMMSFLVSFHGFSAEIQESITPIMDHLSDFVNSDIMNTYDVDALPLFSAQVWRISPRDAGSISDPFVKVCRKFFGIMATSKKLYDDRTLAIYTMICLNMILCSESHCTRILESYDASPLIRRLVDLLKSAPSLPKFSEHDETSLLTLLSRLPVSTKFLTRSRLPVGSYDLRDLAVLLNLRALAHLFRLTDLPQKEYFAFFRNFKSPRISPDVSISTWAPSEKVQKDTIVLIAESYYTVIVADYRVNGMTSKTHPYHYCKPLDLLGGVHISSLSERGTLNEALPLSPEDRKKALKKISKLQNSVAITHAIEAVIDQRYAFPTAERLIILSLLLTRPEIPRMRSIVNKIRKNISASDFYRLGGDMIGIFLSSEQASRAVKDFSSWTIEKRTTFSCCQDSDTVAFDALVLGLLVYSTFGTTSPGDIFSDMRLHSLFIILFSDYFPVDLTIYVAIFIAYLTNLQKNGTFTLLNNLAFSSCDEGTCKAPLFFLPLLIDKLVSIEPVVFACPWHNSSFDTRLGRFTTVLFDKHFKADFYDEISGINKAWSSIFRFHTWLMTLSTSSINPEKTLATEYEKSLALISQLTDGTCQCVIDSMDFGVMKPILIYASKNTLSPSAAAIITRFFAKNRGKLLYLPLILPAIESLLKSLPDTFIKEYSPLMMQDAAICLTFHKNQEKVAYDYLRVLSILMKRSSLHSADPYLVKGMSYVLTVYKFEDTESITLLSSVLRRLSSPDFHFLNLQKKVPKILDILFKFVKEFKQKDASIAVWRYALQDRSLLRYVADHEDLLITASDLAFNDNKDPQSNIDLPIRGGVRLISFDGGGIRGLAELFALKELSTMTCLAPPQLFDYAAGTSAGGIISTALFFVNLPVEIAVNIFGKLGEFIFDQSRTKNRTRSLASRFRESYDTKLLEYLFQSIFGSKILDHRIGYPKLLIASTNAHLKSQAVIFNNYTIPSELLVQIPYIYRNRISKIEAWKAVRASSAAPTYFRPFKIPQFNLTLSDGASVANNPAVLLLNDIKVVEADRKIDSMLSLSTGFTPPVHSDTSVFSWLFAALESWLDTTATTLAAADICKSTNTNYFRYEPSSVINFKGKSESIKIDEGNHKKLSLFKEMLQRQITVDSPIFAAIAADAMAKIWVIDAEFRDTDFLGFSPRQVLFCHNKFVCFTVFSRVRTPSESSFSETIYQELPRDGLGYISSYEAKERINLGERDVIGEKWSPKWEIKENDFTISGDFLIEPRIKEVTPDKELNQLERNRPGSFRAFRLIFDMPVKILSFRVCFRGKDISGGPFLAVSEE